jgi:hypothetical protein
MMLYLSRKRKQCLHQTVYSHDIIKLWLKSAIDVVNVPWEVVIPVYKKSKSIIFIYGQIKKTSNQLSSGPNYIIAKIQKISLMEHVNHSYCILAPLF